MPASSVELDPSTLTVSARGMGLLGPMLITALGPHCVQGVVVPHCQENVIDPIEFPFWSRRVYVLDVVPEVGQVNGVRAPPPTPTCSGLSQAVNTGVPTAMPAPNAPGGELTGPASTVGGPVAFVFFVMDCDPVTVQG